MIGKPQRTEISKKVKQIHREKFAVIWDVYSIGECQTGYFSPYLSHNLL